MSSPRYNIVSVFLKKKVSFSSQVSKKLNAAQIEAVFSKFDANGDGRLSMEEFKAMMEKSQKQ